MLSSPRCVVAFSQRTTTTTSARHGYVVREKKITTNNSNNASGPRCRRSHRRYGRTWWWVTSSSSTNGEDAEGEKKTSWKVVSESPFASSNIDYSSLASEQPALRIEAESSASASRVDGGGEDDEDVEEELKGIPINSSRRTTKMLFTCNKCGIRTERRVNKQNLTTGTTWVQCGNPSCSVWHKIVDNLGLIYECSEMD